MDLRVMAIGMVNVDILATDLPHVAEAGRVVYCPVPIRTQIGGHPVDVAIDLLNLGFPPDNVAVAVALGKGPHADFVRRVMSDFGLRAYVKSVRSTDTGTNLVLKVIGEDRRFHLDPGANWYLDAPHVIEAILDYKPNIVCVRGGYAAFDEDLDVVLQATDGLRFLDVCPPHPKRGVEFIARAIRFSDLVHCNAIELQLVSGKSTVRAGVDWLLDAGVKMAFVSNGDRGITILNHIAAVDQDAFIVDAIDPTGAGDAFCAGVVYEIANRPDVATRLATLDESELAEFVLRPQAVGAAAASAVGCIGGANIASVSRLMDEQRVAVLQSSRPSVW